MAKITMDDLMDQHFAIQSHRYNLPVEVIKSKFSPEIIDEWVEVGDQRIMQVSPIRQKLVDLCRVIKVARDEGMDAAVLFKLSQSG